MSAHVQRKEPATKFTCPTGCVSIARCVIILLLLLLILVEILVSLMVFGKGFTVPNVTTGVVAALVGIRVCLLLPLVLLSFAGLCLLMAAYGRDQVVVSLSAILQALSGLFILIGLVGYLVLYLRCPSLDHMASWFYVYLVVLAELAFTVPLTVLTKRKIPHDWESLPFICPYKTFEL